jgi:hypothetical protein
MGERRLVGPPSAEGIAELVDRIGARCRLEDDPDVVALPTAGHRHIQPRRIDRPVDYEQTLIDGPPCAAIAVDAYASVTDVST